MDDIFPNQDGDGWGWLAKGGLGIAAQQDSSDPNYWSQRRADLLRKQWDDWKTNYKPYETYYANLVLDPTKRTAMRAETQGMVNQAATQSYNTGLQALASRDQRYGVALDPAEQASRQRKMLSQLAATKSQGLTQLSNYMDDREQQMMSGGIAYGRSA